MRKIYYIISVIILTFLLITRFNVNALSIGNVSEIRIFNLVWYEIEGGPSDTQYYDLVVEIQPGVYDLIDAVIIGEAETLSLYGVIVFQYPRSLSSPKDYKTITFYPLSGSPIHYNNIEYMAIKKFTNRLELYINDDTYLYQSYDTRIEGFRSEYIADWDYQDGYNDGYNEGFQKGREAGYQAGSEAGYEYGYDEGYNVGYGQGKEDGKTIGYENGYDEGYNVGYNKGLNEQIADRDFAYLLRSAFIAIGAFLGINLLPGISIGAIIAVPIVFGIIAFILGRKKD